MGGPSEFSVQPTRDHGGGLDAAIRAYGGQREGWIDLSTGINPVPYPVPSRFSAQAWTALPDQAAQDRLVKAARKFWHVPEGAAILPAPGASALIAMIPALRTPGDVCITTPTYNEHEAAFAAHGWRVVEDGDARASVLVHPNNPDGRVWSRADAKTDLTVIDESFCDVMPENSLIDLAAEPGRVVLKSFGKFWGLAGLRLGFAIAHPDLIAQMTARMGPWAVSGPALEIGATALEDENWARRTRQDLQASTERLDALVLAKGARLVGGTTLFRLYETDNARLWQEQLAKAHIWSRVFPYSDRFVRLGLPAPSDWYRLEAAL